MNRRLTFTSEAGSVYTLQYADEGADSENVTVCSPENPDGVLIPYSALVSLLTIYSLDVHHDWMEHRPLSD